jgi:hypothetical protein
MAKAATWHNYRTGAEEPRQEPESDAAALAYLPQEETMELVYNYLRRHGKSRSEAVAEVLANQQRVEQERLTPGLARARLRTAITDLRRAAMDFGAAGADLLGTEQWVDGDPIDRRCALTAHRLAQADRALALAWEAWEKSAETAPEGG